MFASVFNFKRYLAGVAITWALVLMVMHEKLLKQHRDNEKAAAEILSGYMLRIQCGEEVSILRDRVCVKRFKWVIVNWIKDKCFGEYGVSALKDIDCSVYQYLVFVERVCPFPEFAEKFFRFTSTPPSTTKDLMPEPRVAEDFETLLSQLHHCGKVCRWITARVNSTSYRWITTAQEHTKANQATNSLDFLSDKRDESDRGDIFTSKFRLRILLHMGLLTKEYGLNFGEAALKGGSLGELVQWADLMSALHALGHEVVLSWSPNTLLDIVLPNKRNMLTCQPARTVDLVFTDNVGLEQIRQILGSLYNYRCLIRVLDPYGTDPEFNHPYFNPDKDKARSWGGKGLNPAQFFTQFPHSHDNSFLGFVVEKFEGDITGLKSRNTALLYGKRVSIAAGKGKRNYLDIVHEHYKDMHATMWSKDGDDGDLPAYVNNHKNLEQEKFLALLRKSFVYVGLGSPLEGPAALEAIANGAIFLNPKLVLSQKFADERQTNRKMTSQNPYAEQIGEPYVYTVNIRDLNEVEEALNRIKNTKRPQPFVPPEFTYQGFLERLETYVTNQDFCEEPIRARASFPFVWKHTKRKWPPLSDLQIKVSDLGESCTSTCSRHKMVCGRSFFVDINTYKNFRLAKLECNKHRQLFPRVDYEEFRKTRTKYQQFSVPCFAPCYSSIAEECAVQTDELLFSCICAPPSDIKRLCPCRSDK